MVGLTVITESLMPPGVQAYVPPPVAVKVALPPSQYATSGPRFGAGSGWTTTVCVMVLVQPAAFVIVRLAVYDPVSA